jgi:hypothetical protein
MSQVICRDHNRDIKIDNLNLLLAHKNAVFPYLISAINALHFFQLDRLIPFDAEEGK